MNDLANPQLRKGSHRSGRSVELRPRRRVSFGAVGANGSTVTASLWCLLFEFLGWLSSAGQSPQSVAILFAVTPGSRSVGARLGRRRSGSRTGHILFIEDLDLTPSRRVLDVMERAHFGLRLPLQLLGHDLHIAAHCNPSMRYAFWWLGYVSYLAYVERCREIRSEALHSNSVSESPLSFRRHLSVEDCCE